MIPEAMGDVRRRENMQDHRCQLIIGYQKTQLFVSGCNRHQIIRNWCVNYRMLFTLIWCIAYCLWNCEYILLSFHIGIPFMKLEKKEKCAVFFITCIIIIEKSEFKMAYLMNANKTIYMDNKTPFNKTGRKTYRIFVFTSLQNISTECLYVHRFNYNNSYV